MLPIIKTVADVPGVLAKVMALRMTVAPIIEQVGPQRYSIQSRDVKRWGDKYTVNLATGRCNCPARRNCWHVPAVRDHVAFRAELAAITDEPMQAQTPRARGDEKAEKKARSDAGMDDLFGAGNWAA